MKQIMRGHGVKRSWRSLFHHASKMIQVFLQHSIKTAVATEFLADFTEDTSRRGVVNIDINNGLIGTC